jgi:hypothetical protein
MPFFSIRKGGYNTKQVTGANMQERSSAADASITWLLNRLSSYCLSADLLALIGHSQSADLDSVANSTEKHCSQKSYSSAVRCHQQDQVQQCITRSEIFDKDWIQCLSCGGWVHENCADTDGNMLYYKRDSCKRH